MEVCCKLLAPAALPPGIIVLEAGWVPEQVCTLWRREKYLTPTGKGTPAVQPFAMPTELSDSFILHPRYLN
jgi:hypothetical protein